MLAPGIRVKVGEIPHLCTTINTEYECDHLVGYLAVYRVCLGMAMFFFLMTLIMLKVRTSKDGRAKFQNG